MEEIKEADKQGTGVSEAQIADSEKEKTTEAVGEARMSVEESVLQFLAEEHPDDESALAKLTKIFEKADGITDRTLIELAYKGMCYDDDVTAARSAGYVEGRNETIELEKQAVEEALPKDDGGLPEIGADDLPLLRHIRRSVWDD